MKALWRCLPWWVGVGFFGLQLIYEQLRSDHPSPGYEHRWKGFGEVFYVSDVDLAVLQAAASAFILGVLAWLGWGLVDLDRRKKGSVARRDSNP